MSHLIQKRHIRTFVDLSICWYIGPVANLIQELHPHPTPHPTPPPLDFNEGLARPLLTVLVVMTWFL